MVNTTSWSRTVRALLLAVAVALPAGLASAQSTACWDLTTDGSNINQLLIYCPSGCDATNLAVTVDGEPIESFHTAEDAPPCDDPLFPAVSVWFPLHGSQDTAHVCVSVQGEGASGVVVAARSQSGCFAATNP